MGARTQTSARTCTLDGGTQARLWGGNGVSERCANGVVCRGCMSCWWERLYVLEITRLKCFEIGFWSRLPHFRPWLKHKRDATSAHTTCLHISGLINIPSISHTVFCNENPLRLFVNFLYIQRFSRFFFSNSIKTFKQEIYLIMCNN